MKQQAEPAIAHGHRLIGLGFDVQMLKGAAKNAAVWCG
jgi:hypothetical protein